MSQPIVSDLVQFLAAFCRQLQILVREFRGIPRSLVADQLQKCNQPLDLPPAGAANWETFQRPAGRIVIAAALLSEPSVLLLDEPMNGLDPAERVAVRNVLGSLRKDRLILMSSHLLQDGTEICDPVLFIDRGKIVVRGTVSGLEDRFKVTQLDLEFLAPVPLDQVTVLGTMVQQITPLNDRRYRLGFDGTDRSRTQIHAACQQIGTVITCASSSLTMENEYLKPLLGTRSNSPT
jgi:ABC-type uncharacterized transport system ATPase subunit